MAEYRKLGSQAEKSAAIKRVRGEAAERIADMLETWSKERRKAVARHGVAEATTVYDLAEGIVCGEDFWQEFAGYLTDSAENRGNGDGLSNSYILDLLSGAHNLVRAQFKDSRHQERLQQGG